MTQPMLPRFAAGDPVRLREGTYPGTTGTFIGFRPDPNWADVEESSGRLRAHPVAWLENVAPVKAKIEVWENEGGAEKGIPTCP